MKLLITVGKLITRVTAQTIIAYNDLFPVYTESVELYSSCDTVTPIMDPSSCRREVGIAIGVVVCLAVIVITMILVVQCWWR